jgi:hypothetical protein
LFLRWLLEPDQQNAIAQGGRGYARAYSLDRPPRFQYRTAVGWS